jgi:ABC-type antimicrobial peptide transport system permease subunit
MSEYASRNIAGSRLHAELLSLFALVALVVAACGLYALLTYLVSGARRDWAIRLALGASEMDLRRIVFTQSAVYAIAGTAIGSALFMVASKTLQVAVFNVSLWDPLLLGCSGLVMFAVCILAATVPAVRAGRISALEVITSHESRS